jgi:hypothetical protein
MSAPALNALRGYRTRLAGQVDAIHAQLNAIDGLLAGMGSARVAAARPSAAKGAARRPGRGRRGPRAGSLKEYILKVLSGRGTVAVKDIAAGVVRAGYKSSNKTLAKSVGIALAELKGHVVKVGRGRYRAR